MKIIHFWKDYDILFFVAATLNADLELHLQAGEQLSSIFFAFDRIKYKRLWPRYITDNYDLRINHPKTWEELHAGNIAVTKNDIPFVSIGADHACEHLNKLMKMRAGLVGISNNANARQRFFMVTPELSRIAKQFKCQFDSESNKTTEHHDLGQSAVKKEHYAIDKIKAAILKHGNPFAVEGDKLHNVITPRAPAGRCKVVHLHPPGFCFFVFCRPLSMHTIAESDTETPPNSFLQSEIRHQVLVFHKYIHHTDCLQPLTSLWVCNPLEKILRAPMLTLHLLCKWLHDCIYRWKLCCCLLHMP